MEASHGKLPSCHVGGNWSRASGDVKYLICHVISPNYSIEGSCNFICGNSTLYVATMPGHRYGGHRYYDSRVIAKFGGHRHCGSGVEIFNLSRNLARPRDQRVI